jgi:hypothetical protein
MLGRYHHLRQGEVDMEKYLYITQSVLDRTDYTIACMDKSWPETCRFVLTAGSPESVAELVCLTQLSVLINGDMDHHVYKYLAETLVAYQIIWTIA